jgi:tRNA nucleotidyltransferase (CCA-adding enzyme)
MMASVEELSIDKVEVAIGTATAYETVRGASSVVQQVMELGGHDAMFGAIFFEKNQRVQLIGRSRVSYVDVGEILRGFGGGGHRGAGAASVKDSTLEKVVDELRGALVDAPLQPTRVADIMTRPVQFLQHDMTLAAALEKLDEWGVTGAPVLRDGELSGVCSRRDIRRAEQGDKLELPVSSHMAHEVLCVDHQEPIEDALELMTARDVGRMPVTRDDEIVGIVTRTDLIRRLYMKTRDDSDLET